MRAIVIGSAAGGGFPQWNSNFTGCRRARAGDPFARPRTQTSLAVTADGEAWALVNAAPDLRQQIDATPDLHPRGAARSSPIAAVVLTGGEVDSIAGLLTMRERHSFAVLAPAPVLDLIAANPIFNVLAEGVVSRCPVSVGATFAVRGVAGLTARLFPVPGKAPLYLEGSPADAADDTTVGVELSDGHASLFFVPGCAAMTPELADRLRGAACVLFDGTLWTDDEMVRSGTGARTGRRMGHMSLSGSDGTIAAFAGLGVARKVLVHVNNTNPVLLEDSPEHAAVRAAGWDVAHDGMELVL